MGQRLLTWYCLSLVVEGFLSLLLLVVLSLATLIVVTTSSATVFTTTTSLLLVASTISTLVASEVDLVIVSLILVLTLVNSLGLTLVITFISNRLLVLVIKTGSVIGYFVGIFAVIVMRMVSWVFIDEMIGCFTCSSGSCWDHCSINSFTIGCIVL